MKAKSTDEQLVDIFAKLAKAPDFPVSDIRSKIALVSTPRCGSTMFCDVLQQTGLAGDPKEWLNVRYLSAYGTYFGYKSVNLADYLNFVLRKTTSSNGVFSVNFHVEQYVHMMRNGFDAFTLGFHKAYYLQRRDKLAQAYSLAKAQLTDQWSADTRPVQKAAEAMGRSRVLRALLHISESEEFYAGNIKPRITREYWYEDFLDLGSTNAFAEVLTDIGVPSKQIPSKWRTAIKRQSDRSPSDELKSLRRYICECK